MHNAVVAVMESRLSVRKAAETFNVPRTTLVGRLKVIDRPDLIKVQLNRDTLVDAAVEAVRRSDSSPSSKDVWRSRGYCIPPNERISNFCSDKFDFHFCDKINCYCLFLFFSFSCK